MVIRVARRAEAEEIQASLVPEIQVIIVVCRKTTFNAIADFTLKARFRDAFLGPLPPSFALHVGEVFDLLRDLPFLYWRWNNPLFDEKSPLLPCLPSSGLRQLLLGENDNRSGRLFVAILLFPESQEVFVLGLCVFLADDPFPPSLFQRIALPKLK